MDYFIFNKKQNHSNNQNNIIQKYIMLKLLKIFSFIKLFHYNIFLQLYKKVINIPILLKKKNERITNLYKIFWKEYNIEKTILFWNSP